MTSKIEISHRTIIFTVVLMASIWVLFQIRDILYLLFISFLVMTALRPLVEWLARFKIPRIIAIFIIYLLVFGFLGFSVASTIPLLVMQVTKFVAALPSFVSRVMPYWDIDVRALTQQIAPIGENIVRVTVGVFSNIVTTLTVLVFTFYFLLERRNIRKLLLDTLGEERGKNLLSLLTDIEERLGAWVRGQLFLMVTIGVLTYIGLTLLHVEYALPLAVVAGILEIVPMIGPIISAVPAVFVAFTASPFLALSVAALYFIIQQVENHAIVPFVMRRSVGLSPLITIVALMIGAKLAGVVGAVLAVPVVLVAQVMTNELLTKKSVT
ncbi:AI-2E family transporter [Candidatus Gottesmanbacteria bacterium]|nr:AI-2E family transporter [Candidatus Gottesmanbacteria bacterium]